MSAGLFSAVEIDVPGRAGYRLHHVEVFNWGTFDGQIWRLTPGADTSLLTGDIGSGKSTLVDAVTTLLLPSHRITYNKAAGAGAKERSLRSYVEGHYKSERTETTGRTRPIGLRTGGRTYSVILGVFVNEGYDETVTLAQVFQQRETTGQPYRFFATASKELSIAADFADFGANLNDLRRRLRTSQVQIFDEYPKYGTSLRRLLGIRSEQALELFHQTVSMKSVGNLDDFVRDHMLEPSDASGRVREIIGHFENLTKSYEAVKRAREQLEALDPIKAVAEKYDAVLVERADLERDSAAVELYIAELRSALLDGEIAALDETGAALQRDQDAAKERKRRLGEERDTLIAERAGAGGDRIGELERLVAEAAGEIDKRRRAKAQFDQAVADAGLDPVADSDGFTRLTALVGQQRPKLAQRKRELDAAGADAIGREKEATATAESVGAELDSLRQRTNNLPLAQVTVRDQLCADLGLNAAELPYAGELLDVAAEHAEWRGAAERVLRPFALSLLVPQQHYEAVSGWVNGRRLVAPGRGGRMVGVKLVYERVPARQITVQYPGADELRLSDCFDIKPGPFADYCAAQLATRADHRCALTLDEFREQRRAVTREGQVRSGDRHEKDDRHRVDDPRHWVLGWANERKIAMLQGELAQAESERDTAAADYERVQHERDEVQRTHDALVRLEGYDAWVELDPAEAERRLAEYESERDRLVAGSSRLAEIDRALQHHAEATGEIEATLEALTGQLATAAREREQASQAWARDQGLVAAADAAALAAARERYAALDARVGTPRPARSGECADTQTTLSRGLHQRIERLFSEESKLGQRLVGHMTEVLRKWPGLATDMDASVEARADFLAFRDRIATDDLPRFEDEFKDQLNKNAIQELAGFNNWLGRQASAIDERVEKINSGLKAVPYNPGRYICLEKQSTSNHDVIQFRKDLRDLTDDSLVADDDHYSEQRFADVSRIIERFKGREGYADADRTWTRRVTDVRNWFVFSASERDMDTDIEWEHYSDSDGKSGGQKEKLAYTILAASLAYQFGLEWGAVKSKDFRFALIDEAFGRGSDASTRYALELFAKLGLQLLVVTPLQKVHVIEPYVHSIGFVDNPAGTASRVHTMTIEQYRTERDRVREQP